jgi:hypothetical protein
MSIYDAIESMRTVTPFPTGVTMVSPKNPNEINMVTPVTPVTPGKTKSEIEIGKSPVMLVRVVAQRSSSRVVGDTTTKW